MRTRRRIKSLLSVNLSETPFSHKQTPWESGLTFLALPLPGDAGSVSPLGAGAGSWQETLLQLRGRFQPARTTRTPERSSRHMTYLHLIKRPLISLFVSLARFTCSPCLSAALSCSHASALNHCVIWIFHHTHGFKTTKQICLEVAGATLPKAPWGFHY